jgi:hypothetical protein
VRPAIYFFTIKPSLDVSNSGDLHCVDTSLVVTPLTITEHGDGHSHGECHIFFNCVDQRVGTKWKEL